MFERVSLILLLSVFQAAAEQKEGASAETGKADVPPKEVSQSVQLDSLNLLITAG